MSTTESRDTILWTRQQERNRQLLQQTPYLGGRIQSQVVPFQIDIERTNVLSKEDVATLEALQIEAARIAIRSLASLAKIGELDHLGGGLELVPSAILTMAVADNEKIVYTIEHAHTSIGHYAVLAAYEYVRAEDVINRFRRSIDIPGHVSWLAGGTELNGGRLGVMVPAAVGQILGKRAIYGSGVWSITHCGDAGWISGQALNGFNAAAVHKAPITFVMHRNGIQLSGPTRTIMDQDPRRIIASFGIEVVEIDSLHDTEALFAAYRHAYSLAQAGKASLIYPIGFRSTDTRVVDLNEFAQRYGIVEEVTQLALKNNVSMATKIWIPGSLMSYRDIIPMIECVFLVNGLPGGVDHHDGHMKGRDEAKVLSNRMLQFSPDQQRALETLRSRAKRSVVTVARPQPGTINLKVPADVRAAVKLADPGASVSPRAGVEAGYAAIARTYPNNFFVVSCDLDTSTKLLQARKALAPNRQFEMSIEEQASTLLANGLAMSSNGRPQLNVVSTFGAFFEGIAREGFEMWRYQRNLTGSNEGLNVAFHLSHVGACTGRDHFSGWSLDWITLAIGYLPYLHRFYAPADARSAFIAVCDLAAHYGGHIIGIPRDNLPILEKQDKSGPLFKATDEWEGITKFRSYPKAKKAVLAFGAPAFLADQATATLQAEGISVDVYVVNGLPLDEGALAKLFKKYRQGIVTIEDGIIGTRATGLRGFAGLVATAAYGKRIPMEHIGIIDPRIAPADGHIETWEHFGITAEAIVDAVKAM